MNSKDRRKLKRKFPYTIEMKRLFITKSDNDDLYDRLSEMDQWCDKQFGKGKWDRDSRQWYVNLYKFKLSEHKIWFVMRWS